MARSGKSSSANANRPKATPEDIIKWQQAWSKMMVEIWTERIQRLHILDTWTLHQSVREGDFHFNDTETIIQHKFVQYGIYQDLGVGRGYTHGNGGYLEMFDKDVRGDKVAKERPRREWFSRPYYASVMVLKEQMQYMYGEEFCGLIANAVENADSTRTGSLRTKLWGHKSKNK